MSEKLIKEDSSPKGAPTPKSCPTCGCTGKNPGYDKLTLEDVDNELSKLSLGIWKLSEDHRKITMEFKTRNWKGALAFINEASEIAESEEVSHHPDIHLTMYRQIEVVVWTHATGGLTISDFILAKALEDIKVDYSPKWLESHPEFMKNKL